MGRYLRRRVEIEACEAGGLAGYALKSGESRGRRYEEAEHEWRTCFQRDRDRVIHCAAFRRLEAKTQVFLGERSDYYRTRLTHTMEVAQIARTMARILGLNEDLAEAAALAHDLGHPPYGHGGEAVLNELMTGHGGFEHNQQSRRIVEHLEHPYPAFRGLNLTYETRECLAKHQSRYDAPGRSAEFGEGRGPLEGQVADLADAIAYNSHDLDDALAAGLIGEADLAGIELYEILREKVGEQFGHMKRQVRQLRCAKGLIDMLAVDAACETERRLAEEQPSGVEAVREAGRNMVDLSADGRRRLNQLEEFLMAKVYQHPRVAEGQKRAGEELRALFEAFDRKISHMPERYRERVAGEGAYRVICDYIAGMTDRFCREMYKKIRIGGRGGGNTI